MCTVFIAQKNKKGKFATFYIQISRSRSGKKALLTIFNVINRKMFVEQFSFNTKIGWSFRQGSGEIFLNSNAFQNFDIPSVSSTLHILKPANWWQRWLNAWHEISSKLIEILTKTHWNDFSHNLICSHCFIKRNFPHLSRARLK